MIGKYHVLLALGGRHICGICGICVYIVYVVYIVYIVYIVSILDCLLIVVPQPTDSRLSETTYRCGNIWKAFTDIMTMLVFFNIFSSVTVTGNMS